MYYIYEIENISNNKKYIGCSKRPNKRFKEHKKELFKNNHPNERLQNSWNKHGENSFIFTIIMEFDSEEGMFEKERELISECLDCYNIAEGGLGGNSTKNYTDAQKKVLRYNKSLQMKKYCANNDTTKFNPFLEKTEDEREKMLEVWSTCKRGAKNGRASFLYSLLQIDKADNIVKIWNNIYEASETTGFTLKYIKECAKNNPKFKTHKGYKWVFI